MPPSGSWFSHERMLFREDRRSDPALWTDESPEGMVASAHYLATEAGARMLALGGNAFDAAVATSLALCVCEPAGSSLAGMVSLVLHRADSGRTLVTPGACRAPRLATPAAVAAGKRYRGYRAAAVPALPAVLDRIHREHGRLPLAELFGPAIRLARDGYPLTALQHRLVVRFRKALSKGSAGRLFLDREGEALPPGARIRQPELASTLERLAAAGLRDFYEGEVARELCKDMTLHGGFLREEDLAGFPVPVETEPIETRFGEWTVRSPGPPAGGIALLEMLNLLGRSGTTGDDTAAGAVRLATIIRRCRQDRSRYRLETGSESLGGAAGLLTPEYATALSGEIARELSGTGETTHISIADHEGNMVAMTQSIERCFGSAEMCTGLGIIHNGYLRAFKIQNERHPHFLRPGAVARSNASPTILLRDGQACLALGSTGSERLASGIFQVLVRLLHETPFEAVAAPRLHCTPRGVVILEADRFPREVLDALSSRGLELKRLLPHSFKAGAVQLVVKQPDGYCGVADPRRDGAASGPRS